MTIVETEKGLNIEVFFNHFSFQRKLFREKMDIVISFESVLNHSFLLFLFIVTVSFPF